MYEDIKQVIPEAYVRWDEPMKNHTSFRIGGPADCMVFPSSVEQVNQVISWCRNRDVPFLVIGSGTNILVRDKGIRGVVIKLAERLSGLAVEGQSIYAEAGVLLSHVSQLAAEKGLSGLEFAEGIPGSVGGAVYMNAGAYDGEMKNVIYEVTALDSEGNLAVLTSGECDFDYRKSIFQRNGYVILAARMLLKPGDTREITAKMNEFAERRRQKQPLEFPSAGSVFRRPEGYFVGPLIEELGLKGYHIGGAEISTKHAGSIINTAGATAEDVLALIELVQARGRESTGLNLEPEIRIVGEA